MAVSKRLRYEVLRRDQHACRYCGATAPDAVLTVDHVVPVALGGADDPSNLVAACKDCNAGKTSSNPDSPLVADVDEIAARYAIALNRVIEDRAAKFAAEEQHLRWFDKVWGSWASVPLDRDGNWENSILRFLGAGLSESFLERAVSLAMGNTRIGSGGNRVWRYFCGICWAEIKEIADEASFAVTVEEEYDPTNFSVPWVSFGATVTCDLFNLVADVDDDGYLGAQLVEQVFSGVHAMYEKYSVECVSGADEVIAADRAVEALSERNRYTSLIDETRRMFKAAKLQSEGAGDGA